MNSYHDSMEFPMELSVLYGRIIYIYMEFPMIIVAIMISVSYHPLAAQVTF